MVADPGGSLFVADWPFACLSARLGGGTVCVYIILAQYGHMISG